MTKFEVKLLVKILEEKQERTKDRITRYRELEKERMKGLTEDEMYSFGFASGEKLGYLVILNLLKEYLQEIGEDSKLTHEPECTDRGKGTWEKITKENK